MLKNIFFYAILIIRKMTDTLEKRWQNYEK